MDRHHGWYVSAKPLWIGFFFSLFLTALAVGLSLLHFELLKGVLLSLAFAQAVIQLVFFMHLGIEEKPRWNLLTFLLLAVMIVVVVVGSIWIMYHLNYNVMPDMEH